MGGDSGSGQLSGGAQVHGRAGPPQRKPRNRTGCSERMVARFFLLMERTHYYLFPLPASAY